MKLTKAEIKQHLQNFWKQSKARLWGPFGSLVLHVVVVFILIKFAVNSSMEKAPPVIVEMTIEADATKLDEIDKAVEEIKVEQEILPPTDIPPPPSDVASIESSVDSGGTEGPGGSGNQETGTGIGSGDPSLATGFEISAVKGPLVLKGLMANRTAGGRKGAISKYGGTGSGEVAVSKALRWLKEHQRADGSWDASPAMTGLALLTFLAHGETPSSPEYGPTVEKAIKWLISKQSANGSFAGSTYVHGIATYALSEAFAMTKIVAVKEAMEKGIDVIIKGQAEKGGYDYQYGNSGRWDMSCCGWQYQAMKAAKMAGSTHPDLDKAIKKALFFLKEWAPCPTGGWGYSGNQTTPGGGASWTMTSAGTLAMQLLGQGRSPLVKAGLKYLDTAPLARCEWPDKGKGNVYGWYYLTQARFQAGGDDWDTWNKQFSRVLPSKQKPDGHWEDGDHDPGSFVYTTTLCALMLQVYYRYLPTNKLVEDTSIETKSSSGDSGDASVQIL